VARLVRFRIGEMWYCEVEGCMLTRHSELVVDIFFCKCNIMLHRKQSKILGAGFWWLGYLSCRWMLWLLRIAEVAGYILRCGNYCGAYGLRCVR
jgi:hypothetical protein